MIGADLGTTTIGGIGTLGGQSTSNTAAQAANVTGKADAESDTDLSTGLDAFSTSISSDATLQGIGSVTSTAAATTSTGDAEAENDTDDLTGAELSSLTVGGVGSVTGQATFDGSASAETVVGDSDADSQLDASTGLDAGFINVSSDAGLTGLTSITNIASAQSTSGGNADTFAETELSIGADLASTTIGGIGTLGGQSTSNTAAQAANVTGKADAESETDTQKVLMPSRPAFPPMPLSRASVISHPVLQQPPLQVLLMQKVKSTNLKVLTSTT